jgi:hypothetical protein
VAASAGEVGGAEGHPQYVERYRKEAHVSRQPSPYEAAAQQVGREEQPNADPKSR